MVILHCCVCNLFRCPLVAEKYVRLSDSGSIFHSSGLHFYRCDTVVITIVSLKSDKKCDFEFHIKVHKESHNQNDYKQANSLAGH